MDRKKQIDLVRKRNAELTEQLEDLKFKLEYNKQLNTEGYDTAKNLINDLEIIKSEWLDCISNLHEYENEYSDLISDLREIKSIMNSMGFRIPWYRKVIIKLRAKFNKN